jgi:hypothetical protein
MSKLSHTSGLEATGRKEKGKKEERAGKREENSRHTGKEKVELSTFLSAFIFLFVVLGIEPRPQKEK